MRDVYKRQGDGQTGLPNVIRHDDGQPVDFTNPIHPNQAISIYLDLSLIHI